MPEDISIWTSVVVARLPEPRSCLHKRKIHSVGRYTRIADLKTRLSSQQVYVEGKSVVLKLQTETWLITEDEQGHLYPSSRRDVIKERVALADFSPPPDSGSELRLVAEITDFNSDMLIQDSQLVIIYYLTFRLLVLRDQIVALQAEKTDQLGSGMPELNAQAHNDSLRAENLDLRRQLKLYATNLYQLKKSLQKAETMNDELSRQIKDLQIRSSQTKTGEKNNRAKYVESKDIKSQENIVPVSVERLKLAEPTNAAGKIIPLKPREAEVFNMGKRIKEFFITNA